MRKAEVKQLNVFYLHGEPYFEVAFAYLDEPDRIQVCRLGNEAVPPYTQPGEIVEVHALLSTVLYLKRPAH